LSRREGLEDDALRPKFSQLFGFPFRSGDVSLSIRLWKTRWKAGPVVKFVDFEVGDKALLSSRSAALSTLTSKFVEFSNAGSEWPLRSRTPKESLPASPPERAVGEPDRDS
jgi:hypothetical protein